MPVANQLRKKKLVGNLRNEMGIMSVSICGMSIHFKGITKQKEMVIKVTKG